MVIDLDLCVGCRGCEVACRQEHDLAPRIAEAVDVRTVPIPYWTRVDTVGPLGVFPDLTMCYVPRMCNHCEDAPCVAACPTGAMVKREDGPVVLDQDRCIACLNCLHACPFQAIFYDKEEDRVSKCTMCVHLIDCGLEPACVSTCVTRCRVFGDLHDPRSEPRRLLEAKKEGLLPIPAPWGSPARPSVFYVAERQGPRRLLRAEGGLNRSPLFMDPTR